MRFRLAIFAAAFFAIGTADASAFAMGFRWCSTGSSPVISLSGVPKGTASLQFHMDDLDFAAADHGGGLIAYTGQKTIPCGALQTYRPPAPPSGAHRYRINVVALGSGNTNLGTASFTRKFPE
jgi:phosphatidylethanolamine-binding protein (PEBP) family uncharacterized protein